MLDSDTCHSMANTTVVFAICIAVHVCAYAYTMQMQTKKTSHTSVFSVTSLVTVSSPRTACSAGTETADDVCSSLRPSARPCTAKQTGIQCIRSKRRASSLKSKPFETVKYRDYHLENMWPIPGFGAAYFPGAARPSYPY